MDSYQKNQERVYKKNHVMIMKVALAIAILRQKPKSVLARSYTRQLAQQFQQDEVEWRKRARELEKELLRTRQELVKCQLQNTTAPLDDEMEQSGWLTRSCDMEWQCSGLPVLKNEAGAIHCDGDGDGSMRTGNVTGRRHRNEDSDCGRKGVSTSACRSLEVKEGGVGSAVHSHIVFLKSTSSMACLHRELPAVISAELVSTVRDTVLEIIRGLRESLTVCIESSQDFHFSKEMLASAASMLADMTSLPVLESVRDEVTTSLVGLANVLVRHDNRFMAKQWWQDVVVNICSVQAVLVSVLKELTLQLSSSVKLLTPSPPTPISSSPSPHSSGPSSSEQVAMKLTSMEVVDAIDRQSSMMEKLLMKYDASKNMATRDRYKLASDLEDSILDHSLCYPLVTYAIWRIVAMYSK